MKMDKKLSASGGFSYSPHQGLVLGGDWHTLMSGDDVDVMYRADTSSRNLRLYLHRESKRDTILNTADY